MPAIAAKLVTIVTLSHYRERVESGLRALGAANFSVSDVHGRGLHDEVPEGPNLMFTVVAGETLASRITVWVEQDLIPNAPCMAYVSDVMALHQGGVPGTHR